jgi:hypothetical protein
MSKPLCVYQSPMWTRSGYGDLALAIAKSLYRYDKFDLAVVPTKWGGCSRKSFSNELLDPVEKALFERIVRQPLNRQPDLYIQCTIPNEFQTPGKYNIGITAGIETTVARPDWVEGLNRMNLNLVTSVHAKEVFEKATYSKNDQNGQPVPGGEMKSLKPIEVLGWGADVNIYGIGKSFEPKLEIEFENIKEDFCFLFVGQWTHGGLFSDRKDIGNLIKVFLHTFADMGNKPKPALIIKTSGAAICNMDKYDIIGKLKAITQQVQTEKKTKDLPSVYLLYGELTEPEMNALFTHEKVRAHVSFTHGEGYGHPLLLASLSGKPLLAAGWSGHLDFLDAKYCKLLEGELKPLPPECVNEWLIKESAWFYVDYAKASETMKNCFYYYKPFAERAELLRKQNVEKFSMEAMDRRFFEILDRNVPKFATEQKLILPKLKKVSPPKIDEQPVTTEKEITLQKV